MRIAKPRDIEQIPNDVLYRLSMEHRNNQQEMEMVDRFGNVKCV